MARPFSKITPYTHLLGLLCSNQPSRVQFSAISILQNLHSHRRAQTPKSYSTSSPIAPFEVKFRSLAPPRSLGCWVANRSGSGGVAVTAKWYHGSSSVDISPASGFDLEKAMSRHTDASLTLATRLMTTEAKNKNFACSPTSINVVLSLIASGSEGKTLDEFLSYLKSKSKDELGKLVSEIVGKLLVNGATTGGPKLAMANGVWFDESIKFKSKFAQVVNKVYKSDVKQVDFRNKYSEVAVEVNSWVSKKTKGHVEKILPSDSVDPLTRLILTNAIYFKGLWAEKFDRFKTMDHPFHLLSGANVKVPFMTSNEKQYVEQFDGFKVLRLPYKRGKEERRFSMYIFLPDDKDGISALVEKLSSGSNFLDEHIPMSKVKLTKFLIPKFKISYGFEASNALRGLGVVSPFTLVNGITEIADSMIGEEGPVYVTSVFHKTFIEVNEEGTEAVAATRFHCGLAFAPGINIMNFVADHPFLFVIREDTTGFVLFVGQILDPTLRPDFC